MVVVPSCPHKTKPKAKRGVHGTYGVYLKKGRKERKEIRFLDAQWPGHNQRSLARTPYPQTLLQCTTAQNRVRDLILRFCSLLFHLPNLDRKRRKEQRAKNAHSRTRTRLLSLHYLSSRVNNLSYTLIPTYPIELHTRV